MRAHRYRIPRLPGAIPLLVLVLLLAGCASPSPTEPRYAPAERLTGSWRWQSSLNVRTQQLLNPATEGFEAELHFVALSPTSGTFSYTKAGSVVVQGQFSIAYEDAPGNDFIVIEPGIDFLERNAWLSVGPNNLHLGGVMELGYNSQYVRVITQ